MSKISLYMLLLVCVLKSNGEGWGRYNQISNKHPIKSNHHSNTSIHHIFRTIIRTGPKYLMECKYQICTHVKGYPEDHINEAMEQRQSLISLLQGVVFNASADDTFLSTRGKFDPKESEQLCRTESWVTLTPRLMRNVNNEIKMIVNTERHRQTFTVEACRDFAYPEKSEVNDTCTSWGFSCKQNHQTLSLLTYDLNSSIRFDTFTIPTVCKCCAA